MKLAEEDIGYTQLLMPLQETRAHVDEAAGKIHDRNFFDANLALKAAEDGLSVETVMLVETPKPVATATATGDTIAATPAQASTQAN